jgi:hypothetical protein
MSTEELDRLGVIRRVVEGRLPQKQAAIMLGAMPRQRRRGSWPSFSDPRGPALQGQKTAESRPDVVVSNLNAPLPLVLGPVSGPNTEGSSAGPGAFPPPAQLRSWFADTFHASEMQRMKEYQERQPTCWRRVFGRARFLWAVAKSTGRHHDPPSRQSTSCYFNK